MEISIGVPSKPKLSRSLLWMNLLYCGSKKPVVNNMNFGGLVEAWVANKTLGCLPPLTGCGNSMASSCIKVLSFPVGILRSQLCSDTSRDGTSFSRWRPVRAEMFTLGAQET